MISPYCVLVLQAAFRSSEKAGSTEAEEDKGLKPLVS